MLSPLEQGSAVVLQLAKDAVSIAAAAAPTPTDVSLAIPTVNILAAAAAAAATATATSVPDVGDNDDDYRVYKRWRERPQRPVKIWFFDVSKQVFGSVLVHIANVFMSMLTSGRFSFETADSPIGPMATMLLRRDDDDYSPNPCSFYLLNLGIDTTLGIPILIYLLRLWTGVASLTRFGQPPQSIQSGNYGDPPNWRWWLKQSLLYFCGLFGMKTVVLIILVLFPSISRIGDWALGWTEGNEKLQIFFVMMLFPLIMNALQYYIIDSFIKMQPLIEHELIPGEDPENDNGADSNSHNHNDNDENRRRSSASRYDGDHFDTSSDDLSTENDTYGVRLHRSRSRRSYGSEGEGDGDTLVQSSGSSRGSERGSLLPSSLYPKE
ncbi:unnamed protein product [Parascedosporium putredinis]|uniref:Vacuolar membrane protein n=1 Tax=Parascedosporium putredinis TaxID=1442378 RepID=A0A9P1H717_9PEZI|nr:unnamed protein product [Parascedosporium putredinis]CAI7998054.1 unnamed protein product [Parascedosporium putredinis]